MKQTEVIIDHLNTHDSISSMEAITMYGITRLAAVISLLKKEGYLIGSRSEKTTTRLGNKTHYKRYFLVEAE